MKRSVRASRINYQILNSTGEKVVKSTEEFNQSTNSISDLSNLFNDISIKNTNMSTVSDDV